MSCMCGDSECPSCGIAQGTLTEERLDDLRRTPRQADVTDVEDLCSEIERLRTALKRIGSVECLNYQVKLPRCGHCNSCIANAALGCADNQYGD